MDAVLQAIRDIYANGIEQNHEGAKHLNTLCKAIDRIGPEQNVPTNSFPVVKRYLKDSLSFSTNQFAGALAEALGPVYDRLYWQQPDYGDAPEFNVLPANYAYTLLVGPERWSSSNYYCEEVFFGLSLQAPNTLYADHVHKAIEIYYVVNGKSRWKRGPEIWTEQISGSLIFHDRHVAHAMQSFDEPLLSLFAWVSDLDGEIVGIKN